MASDSNLLNGGQQDGVPLATSRLMRNRMGKRLFIAALALVVAWGVACAVMFFNQRSLVYLPEQSFPGQPADWGWRGARDVTLRTEDGLELSAWLFEPGDIDRNIAVLFAPGNAGHRGYRGGLGERLMDLGYTVLLLDYRGYGGNPGSPTEEGLALDAKAGVAWLAAAGFPSSRTIYVGESLGTGVVVRLASTDPPAGLLLRSPYTSLVDVAANMLPFLPVGLLLQDRFDTVQRLPLVKVPITVMAGGDDTFVPTSQSVVVADLAPDLFRLIVVDGVGHNDVVWLGPDLSEAVDELARHSLGE